MSKSPPTAQDSDTWASSDDIKRIIGKFDETKSGLRRSRHHYRYAMSGVRRKGRGKPRRSANRTYSDRRGGRHGLRIPSRGLPADKPELPPGDLFVVVRTADDLRFERHGRDLYQVETIDVVNAVLGTSIDVLTLDGQVSVKVPAGTQPDSMLRLRGKGLPHFGGGARGDLFVRLQIHVWNG